MHILQVISGDKVNGAVTYVKFLSEQLAARGHQVSILHRHNNWLVEQAIPGVQYMASDLCRTPRELRRIAGWVRDHQVDVVHTHMSRAHFFGVLLKLITGGPVVATAHSCNFQLHWIFNDFVIANSKSTLEYHRRVNRVQSGKSGRIHCFTNLDRFRHVDDDRIQATRKSLRASDGDFVVGVVGQVGPRKNQRGLFDCLPGLFDRIPGLRVVVLGQFCRESRYARRLRIMHLKQGWTGRIKWTGMRSNVEDYMNAMDLCVVPSLREPLGLVALESLAAGTPVVASRVGGLPEIVSDGETGLLVPARDSRRLSEAIIQLYEQPDLRREMGQRGRAMTDQKFRPAVLTQQVVEVYERVLAAGMPDCNAASRERI